MSIENNLPDHIKPGNTVDIGSYVFTKEDILSFASAWDPQVFHTDEQAAKDSLLGGLCASGWHTVSVWMKLQRASLARHKKALEADGKTTPEFGPSPGMKHIKWIRPVYVDDRISYSNRIIGIRNSKSKLEWQIMNSKVFATNQNEDSVMTFESTVFLKVNSA